MQIIEFTDEPIHSLITTQALNEFNDKFGNKNVIFMINHANYLF